MTRHCDQWLRGELCARPAVGILWIREWVTMLGQRFNGTASDREVHLCAFHRGTRECELLAHVSKGDPKYQWEWRPSA